MRIVIAMMKHETNTFSPVPTPLERFGRGRGGPAYGRAAYEAFKGTGTPMGAFIDLAERAGAEVVTPIAAEAWPSARVQDAAYRTITDAICEAVDKGCDAVLLDLHGAMVTESLEDGEGELLARVRALAPGVPIGAAFDMHTNLTRKTVENADVIAGYQTYPHVDMYETGVRAGRPILAMLEGRVRPTMAWGNRPMLPHIMRQGTDDHPNRELQAMARQMEVEGALAATVFTGFPHADIHDAGLSAVVVTDGDDALARRWRGELLDRAWGWREDFVYRIEPLEQSVARAKRMTEGPVIMLDHFDNTGSGGTMDTTRVLAEVMRQGLRDAVFFAICDPEAVARLVEAGVGNGATVSLGGRYDMPSIGRKGEPLEVTGRVRLISDGNFVIRGPMYTGVRVGMGRSVVLDTGGGLEIVVLESHHEPWDLGCLQSLGIDPRAKRYVILKSRIHYRAGFKPIAKAIVECAGVGVCTSDYGELTFERVRRPIYPLDLINDPAPRG